MTFSKITLSFFAGVMLTSCAVATVSDAILGSPTAIVAPAALSPNPFGISGSINARDAASLSASLEAMVVRLSQKDKLNFMEAFFRVSQFDRCDETGQWRERGNAFNGGRKSFGSCVRAAYNAQYFDTLAKAYVSNNRLDENYAYTASNAFGTRTGGNSVSESYVNFISLYGDQIDGRDANYIIWRNSEILGKRAKSQRGKY